jgi:hypothetical protein
MAAIADLKSSNPASVFARELVALQPDVILAQGTPVTAALKRETRTIPIVFATILAKRRAETYDCVETIEELNHGRSLSDGTRFFISSRLGERPEQWVLIFAGLLIVVKIDYPFACTVTVGPEGQPTHSSGR